MYNNLVDKLCEGGIPAPRKRIFQRMTDTQLQKVESSHFNESDPSDGC